LVLSIAAGLIGRRLFEAGDGAAFEQPGSHQVGEAQREQTRSAVAGGESLSADPPEPYFGTHAKLPFLSLDNQKVPTTAWRRLACSRDQSTHSPDSPALARE
jgi:hypothetical protein